MNAKIMLLNSLGKFYFNEKKYYFPIFHEHKNS